MYETPFTIVGNIVTNPVSRRVGEQTVVSFRVASNARKRKADGEWDRGKSLFVSVSCWDRLVSGVAPLAKGDPVIVVGHVFTNEYDDRDGVRRTSIEVRADAVGPNLARATVRLDKLRRSTDEPAPAETVDELAEDEEPSVDPDTEDGLDGLPLTA